VTKEKKVAKKTSQITAVGLVRRETREKTSRPQRKKGNLIANKTVSKKGEVAHKVCEIRIWNSRKKN